MTVNLGLQGTAQLISALMGTDTFVNMEDIRDSRYIDILIGDAGDNSIRGIQGCDTIDGGACNDRVDYLDQNVVGGFTVDLSNGLGIDPLNTTDTLLNIETFAGRHSTTSSPAMRVPTRSTIMAGPIR